MRRRRVLLLLLLATHFLSCVCARAEEGTFVHVESTCAAVYDVCKFAFYVSSV